MIKKLSSKDSSIIHEVINKAARAYRGVIPEDCYHEPYMQEQELRREMASMTFFGWGQGAIDTHYHGAPCPTAIRRSEIEYGIRATEVGMQAIANKGMTTSTARSAVIAQEMIDYWAREHNKKPCKIIGGVTLCYSVGGLNVEAVINAAQLGGKFVWTPTLDSSHNRIIQGTAEKLGHGIDVLDENDEVVPELKEIFKAIAEYDLVLSICHQSTKERLIMVDAARELGVKRIVLVHVFQPVTKLDIEQMKMFIAVDMSR